MNIIRCSIILRRRAERARAFLRASFAEKERNNSKKEKKHHMPDMCRAYDAYEAYEVWKGIFLTPSTAAAVPLPRRGRSGGGEIESLQNVGGRAMRELLPPLRRSPSLEEGGMGGGEIESLQNVGGRAMRAPTTLREIATVRCVCNAGLHHCNG